MGRLITFGCSITEGNGLENPKEEGWAYILSRYANLELVNLGVLGGSNKLITYKIDQFNFEPDDIVLIQWSFSDRYCVIKSKNSSTNMIVQHPTEQSKLYYKWFHTDNDTRFMNKVWITYAINYLLNCKINFRQFYINDVHKAGDISSINCLPVIYSSYRAFYPKAPDGMHMGKEGNLVFAETLYNLIFRNSSELLNII